MQSASKDFNVYFRFVETEENLYSNIDPRTGSVVAYQHSYEHETPNIRRMNKYNNSGLNLSSIESLSRRSDLPRREGCWERCRKAFQHMFHLNIILKYIEIILLGLCIGIFSEETYDKLQTTSTVMMPMITFALFLILAFIVMIGLAAKFHISHIFQITLNTLAVMLTSISGGVILGIWLNTTEKFRKQKYWESVSMLSQSILSFLAAITYIVDLAWSLNSLNKIR